MIEDMTVRNLPPTTQGSYLAAISKLNRHFCQSLIVSNWRISGYPRLPGPLGGDRDIWPSLNYIVCALRFFNRVTPCRSASATRQPVVLSADEVVRFLEAIPSLKSSTALTVAYAARVRVSEVALADIDSQRMVIRSSKAMATSTARTVMSCSLPVIAESPQLLARPHRWMFPGCDEDRPLDPTVLHAACRSAHLVRPEHKGDRPHAATQLTPHLLENGERGRRAHHPTAASHCCSVMPTWRATPKSPPRQSVPRQARLTA